MVDMSPRAIEGRLREMSALLAARGFVVKGVDMSPAAVTARVRLMGALSDMCLRLAREGRRGLAARDTQNPG